jgi:hypothetical protein
MTKQAFASAQKVCKDTKYFTQMKAVKKEF